MSAMLGFEEGPAYIQYMGALLGLTLIVISIFLIAAARDLLKHIYWVKFAIWWAVSGVLAVNILNDYGLRSLRSRREWVLYGMVW